MKPRIQAFLNKDYEAESYFYALQQFLIKRHKKISPHSLDHLYNSLVSLGEFLNNPPLATITKQDLKRYTKQLWRKYAPGTIKPIIGDIKQLFNWCKKKELLIKNPAKQLRKPRPRPAEDKAAPEDMVTQVLNHLVSKLSGLVYRDIFGNLVAKPSEQWSQADKLLIRDLFILVFLYETGARAKEVAELGSAVMERVCKTPKDVYRVTSTGKTEDRDMRFTNATAELWHIWQQVRPTECSDYAVVSLRHTYPVAPLTSNGISLILVRRCKEVGIPIFRPHSLRHAKVNRSYRLVGLEMASILIDHSSIETTRNYTNIKAPEVRSAVLKTGLQTDLWREVKAHGSHP